MYRSRALILLGFAAFLFSGGLSVSWASDEEERLKVAAQYIELSNESMKLDQIVATTVDQMLQAVKVKQPELHAEKAEKLRGIAQPIMMGALTESMKELDKVLVANFTLEELQTLYTFSASDIGKRILSKMPTYTAAIQPAMQRALRASLPLIFEAFQAEGVTLQ